MTSAANLDFKPNAETPRPNQAVYDPTDGTIKEATFEQAQELAKEGIVTGPNAYNELLKNDWRGKAGAAAIGVADFAGIHSLLMGTASKLGVPGAAGELRNEKQAIEQHPGYHAAGEFAPFVAPMFGAAGRAFKGAGALYDLGNLGLKGIEATAEAGLKERALAGLSRGGARLANAATGAVPAFVAKSEADAYADAEAGHKEYDAQKQREEIVKDPFTVELAASTGWHAIFDAVAGGAVLHGAVEGVRGVATAGKGIWGALEHYGMVTRQYHAAPPDPLAAPRFTSYTRVDHGPVGDAKMPFDRGTVIEGQLASEGPKALPESAGPNGMPPEAAPVASDATDVLIDSHDAAARPTPRPEHLQAMVRDHGVISLPGDVPLSHEVAPGIPRAEIVIPKAVEAPEPLPQYEASPKLQRAFEEAKASVAEAEKMQAARLAAEEIPKRDVGLPPEKPADLPPFDPATVEPVFEYNADYSQKHKLELNRLWINDRLSKHSPEALEMWNRNRELTKVYNKFDKDRTAVDWYAQREAARAEKVTIKDKLREMVPRHYNPVTQEYAPGFGDLLDEYKKTIRGENEIAPKMTFGAKGDPEALAQHTANMKQWVKDTAAYEKEAKRAETEYVRANDKAERLAASEAKRVQSATESAQARLKKVEQSIADEQKRLTKKHAEDEARLLDKYNRDVKRASEKAAAQTKKLNQQAETQARRANDKATAESKREAARAEKAARDNIRAAERHAKEIADLEQKQASRMLKETQAQEKAQLAEKAKLDRERARDAERVAKEAEKAKTQAAADAKKAAKEADAYAKAQKKAQDAAKPRWEEKATRESNDEFGQKTETIHTKHENGQTTTKRTIRIKAAKQKPELIAGDWNEPFSPGFVRTVTIGASLLGGAHTGGVVGATLTGVNKAVKYGANSKALHNAFAAIMRHLETNIAPAAAKLYTQSQQRGRRHTTSSLVNVAAYHKTVKGVSYASQNPEAIHSAVDSAIPNLAHIHPELANGMKAVITNGVQALNDQMPKKPFEPSLQDKEFNPPRAAQVSFLRKYKILGNPREALQSGDPMAIKLVSQVYPNIYREYCSQLTNYVQAHKTPMYNRQARLISQFLGANVRPIDDPAALQRLQQSGAPDMPPDPQQKPIGKSSSPTKAASQRASLDSPDASLDGLGG